MNVRPVFGDLIIANTNKDTMLAHKPFPADTKYFMSVEGQFPNSTFISTNNDAAVIQHLVQRNVPQDSIYKLIATA